MGSYRSTTRFGVSFAAAQQPAAEAPAADIQNDDAMPWHPPASLKSAEQVADTEELASVQIKEHMFEELVEGATISRRVSPPPRRGPTPPRPPPSPPRPPRPPRPPPPRRRVHPILRPRRSPPPRPPSPKPPRPPRPPPPRPPKRPSPPPLRSPPPPPRLTLAGKVEQRPSIAVFRAAPARNNKQTGRSSLLACTPISMQAATKKAVLLRPYLAGKDSTWECCSSTCRLASCMLQLCMPVPSSYCKAVLP